MPSASADGPRAANLGGSSLAITSASKNKEAAWAYLNYTLGTNEGQVTMLKEFGLVPSLLTALDDPYVSQEQPYWGGQKVWVDILRRCPRSCPAAARRSSRMRTRSWSPTQLKYLNGEYPDAKAALDDAANQIAAATGLPIAQ